MSGRRHKTIAPVLCLNGSAPSLLISDRIALHAALQKAIYLLERMSPHPRDYQTAPDGTYKEAEAQHARRWNQLIAMERSVLEEIEALSRDRRSML